MQSPLLESSRKLGFREDQTALAVSITRAASKQTYFTMRFLVDKNLTDDAYCAYAYFRWVDDWLDEPNRPRAERLRFIQRQQALLEGCTRSEPPAMLTPEEHLLVTLMNREADPNSGLYTYAQNMMAVMAFDAERRGRFISQSELDNYARCLAVAVTEAMHYFIGHCCASPHGPLRYQAVVGAHIAHMLRDTLDDAKNGYYNIPGEILVSNDIAPWDVACQPYRNWVKERVHAARVCFLAGREYLSQVENFRCRLAGYAYIQRFEIVLAQIEREGYLLRESYPERKRFGNIVQMFWDAYRQALNYRPERNLSRALTTR